MNLNFPEIKELLKGRCCLPTALPAVKTCGPLGISAGRVFTIKKQFLDDLKEQAINSVIKNLDKPLLIFHTPVDQTVGIGNAAHIYKLAKHPKSFISLDDADHLLSNEEDAKYVGSVAAAWVDRYL